MNLRTKIWLLTATIVALIMAGDLYFGFHDIEDHIRAEVASDAKDFRGILMATRRIYHKQFIDSGLPVTDQTIGFLPAQALARIAREFPNWSDSGLSFNNVSDRPRNPDNKADADEMAAIEWFRANPKVEDRLTEIRDARGRAFYHFTAPIWVEAYCLKCHGNRDEAPPSVARRYDTAYGYQVGDLRGVMSIKLPVDHLREREYRAWLKHFSFRLAGYAALLVLLGAFLNRTVVSRLAKLEQSAAGLAEGRYEERCDVQGSDEVGTLAQAFNKMAHAIQERDDALHASEERVRMLNVTLEQQVQARTQELSATNKELEAFAYAVSHDLRSPLRALNGFSTALEEDYGDQLDAQAKDYIRRIARASEKMGELIDGLLDLSRITRGEVQREEIDLTLLAQKLCQEFAANEPQRSMTWDIEPGIVVHGDARMLESLMRNLLGNAWKYSATATAPHVRVFSHVEDGRRFVNVADNGAGFDMDHADMLFKPFHRLHRQDEFPGLGIGLATVMRIINRHGGEIRASAKPGAGATFSFSV